ncbi:unnamed protein product [Nesidiocoris tenuis]|uniref:Uncharacterized protein n=1 Tax=Nesidiocoris tenuis TaxID=355587 RepID=A0A6H5FXI8_9HEMI|nr:unnamed protein product [Nesidiocoris tenuis]
MATTEGAASATRKITNHAMVSPPDKFSFRNEDWCGWRRRYERFRRVDGIDELPQTEQVDHLVYSQGDVIAEDILDWFRLSDDQSKDYSIVSSKFEQHFVSKQRCLRTSSFL